MTGYPLIDVLRTGQRLKEACIKKNIEAKEIKQFLDFVRDEKHFSYSVLFDVDIRGLELSVK